jgi:hypothetical protein
MNSTNIFSIFTGFPDLLVAFSYKNDGSMRFVDSLVDQEILKNRKKFLKRYGVTPGAVVSAELVHGNNVRLVSRMEAGKLIPKTDALVTNENNLYLSITVADCLPIFVYDPKQMAIALIHAGWRSLAANIIKKTVEILKAKGCLPKDLSIGIGPGIGICHFEVKDDVLLKFKRYGEAVENRDGKKFLDLKKIAQQQFVLEGAKIRNVEINTECTYCEEEKYFSNRRDKSVPLKTMIAVIGMK